MNLQFPDLSIVGAPKCGTSSLHYWLAQLKEVCPAQPKETFYFMDVENPLINPRYNFHKNGLTAYKQFFKKGNVGKTLDSTTHYYYQQTAIEQFSAAGTKVCIVLRDPTRRLLSYFQYVCSTRAAVKEPICFSDFTTKLIDGDVGRFRDEFVDEKEFYTLATCLTQGHYVDYVKEWMDNIQAQNLLIVLFEDLISNRQRWLKNIGEFFELKITENDIQKFIKTNETVGIKYPTLNRIVKSTSRVLANEQLKQMGRKFYLKLQKTEKPNLEGKYQHDISRLYEYYKPFNRSLSDLLQIDLSGWTPKSNS